MIAIAGSTTSSSSSGGSAVLGLLFLALLYFIPLIVAVVRKVPNVGSIGVINLFLGWTLIGWVVALAMACRSAERHVIVNQYAIGEVRAPMPPPPPSPSALAPPGWLPDPAGTAQLRYWDGAQWSEHYSPRELS